jgi:hypothetical protein
MIRPGVIAGFLLTVAASCLAQEHQHGSGERLGAVHFVTSCNETAQREFNYTVALLNAIERVREGQAASSCAIFGSIRPTVLGPDISPRLDRQLTA